LDLILLVFCDAATRISIFWCDHFGVKPEGQRCQLVLLQPQSAQGREMTSLPKAVTENARTRAFVHFRLKKGERQK
jgi:hypothetical protein